VFDATYLIRKTAAVVSCSSLLYRVSSPGRCYEERKNRVILKLKLLQKITQSLFIEQPVKRRVPQAGA